MIKGLLRLGDTITLTPEGIQSKILGREEFIAWRDVEAIKIDASYSDGVYYVVSASNGKEIKGSLGIAVQASHILWPSYANAARPCRSRLMRRKRLPMLLKP
jgi:hypothetical protein